MKINLDQIKDLTPKPKTGGAASRKESRRKRSKVLYNPSQVVYHPDKENGS